MPYAVSKRGKGKRPYKIRNKNTGRIVGSSTSKAKANSSIRARNAAKHNPNWKRRKR